MCPPFLERPFRSRVPLNKFFLACSGCIETRKLADLINALFASKCFDKIAQSLMQ